MRTRRARREEEWSRHEGNAARPPLFRSRARGHSFSVVAVHASSLLGPLCAPLLQSRHITRIFTV